MYRFTPIEMSQSWTLALGWDDAAIHGELAARPLVVPRGVWDDEIAPAGLVSDAWRVVAVAPGEGRGYFYVPLPPLGLAVAAPPPAPALERSPELRTAWRTFVMRTELERMIYTFTARLAIQPLARVVAYELGSFRPVPEDWGDTG